MHRPSIALLFAVSFVLAACTPYPTDDPYGYGQRPPRYGHGGTDSPQNANQPWKRQNQQQPVAGVDQPQPGTQTDTGMDPGTGLDPGSDVAGTGQGASDPNKKQQTGATGPAGDEKKPAPAASDKPKYGTPVPGKPGFLYSPHNPDGGYIDIRVKNTDGSMGTLPPGTKIKDPFSSNAILVP